MWAKLDGYIVCESNDVKLLGITLNNKLKFDKDMSNIFSKANKTKDLNKSTQVSSI